MGKARFVIVLLAIFCIIILLNCKDYNNSKIPEESKLAQIVIDKSIDKMYLSEYKLIDRVTLDNIEYVYA